MKKIIFILGLCLISLAVFAMAYTPDDGCYSNEGNEITCTTSTGSQLIYNQNTNQVTYNLNAGWNIIPGRLSLSNKSPIKDTPYYEGTSCIQNNLMGFIYSPTQKKYISSSDNIGNNIISQDSSNGYYYAQYGGIWMYTPNDCKVSFNLKTSTTGGDLITGEGINKKIVKGWNFLTIMPWMKEKTLESILGDCIIENFNMWDVGTQSWALSSKATSEQMFPLLFNKIGDWSIGTTYLIKTSNNCELMKTTLTSPPILPN
jgi:hypothetical protein